MSRDHKRVPWKLMVVNLVKIAWHFKDSEGTLRKSGYILQWNCIGLQPPQRPCGLQKFEKLIQVDDQIDLNELKELSDLFSAKRTALNEYAE